MGIEQGVGKGIKMVDAYTYVSSALVGRTASPPPPPKIL